MRDLAEPHLLEKRKNHTIEAIVDRIVLKPLPSAGASAEQTGTALLREAPRSCRHQGAPDGQRSGPHRTSPAAKNSCSPRPWPAPIAASTCPSWSRAASPSTPPIGACPECHGLGSIYDFDPAKVITDWSKPCSTAGLAPAPPRNTCSRLINLAAERTRSTSRSPSKICRTSSRTSSLYGPAKSEAPAHRLSWHLRLPSRHASRKPKSDGYRE